MRLGIDFGTTQIVAAAAGRCRKRFLSKAGPQAPIDIAGQTAPLFVILSELATDLLTALRDHSNLEIPSGEKRKVLFGSPAGADSNNRFLTVEYGHRHRGKATKKHAILVCDPGARTFDASIVALDQRADTVNAREGIATLGEAVRPDWPQVHIPVADFYVLREPLFAETLNALDDFPTLAQSLGAGYVTAGSRLPADGQPDCDSTVRDEIHFPFDPALSDSANLDLPPVFGTWQNQRIGEQYRCGTGYQRTFRLNRRGAKSASIGPGKQQKVPTRRKNSSPVN